MIAVVDYGVGNISAFLNIYKRLNIPACAARSAEDLRPATRVILPGVGAFDHAMAKLRASGMLDSLDELVCQRKVPALGVCVGMQMLAKASEEGVLPGLNWIDGVVRRFDATVIPYRTKFPHMGWNDVKAVRPSPLLDGLDVGARFYFLHSYYFDCAREADVLGTAVYGQTFAAILNRDNIFGIQCHPEKSHESGVALLRNFATFQPC